jgi:hypothetical protein
MQADFLRILRRGTGEEFADFFSRCSLPAICPDADAVCNPGTYQYKDVFPSLKNTRAKSKAC